MCYFLYVFVKIYMNFTTLLHSSSFQKHSPWGDNEKKLIWNI